MQNVLPLFAVPVYTNKVNFNQKDFDYLKNVNYKLTGTLNGYQSVDTNILYDTNLLNLKSIIDSEIEEYVRNTLGVAKHIEFKMVSSWSMLHNKGHWAQDHVHSNSLISGVLYLQTDKDSGDIVFKKTANYPNLFPAAVSPDIDTYNIFNSQSWTYKPEDGLIIIFPSSLVHEVGISNSDQDRYCVAFNYFICGQISKKRDDCYLNINLM
jgi:uncharacterized protein (TIGR02466 family)